MQQFGHNTWAKIGGAVPLFQDHQEFPFRNSRNLRSLKLSGIFKIFQKMSFFSGFGQFQLPYYVKPVFFELCFGEEH